MMESTASWDEVGEMARALLVDRQPGTDGKKAAARPHPDGCSAHSESAHPASVSMQEVRRAGAC